MSALLLAMSLAAAPLKLAFPGLNAVNLSKEEAALYAEVVAQKLTARHLEVLTARDLEAVMGLERQKQLLGCSESGGCLLELVGALGVDGIVVGDVGRLSEGFVVNVKVLSTQTARPLALYNGRATTAEQARRLLEQASWEVAHQLAAALKRPEFEPSDARPELSEGADPRWWAAVPAAVAVGGGAMLAVFASQMGTQASLLDQSTSLAAATQARDAGKQAQVGVVISGAACGVGAAITAALLIALSPKAVTPTVFITPTGASVGLAGVLP